MQCHYDKKDKDEIAMTEGLKCKKYNREILESPLQVGNASQTQKFKPVFACFHCLHTGAPSQSPMGASFAQ